MVRVALIDTDFGVKHKLSSGPLGWEVYCSLGKCKLRLVYDRMYNSIECLFEDPKNHRNCFSLKSVLNINNVDTSQLYYEYSNVSPEEYLRQYFDFIKKHLMHMLHGDLRSIDRLLLIKKNYTLIQKKLGTSFVFDHPIYLKMIQEDDSWIDDLEQFTTSEGKT